MERTQSHRKTIKHYHQPGDLHELTFSCYRRLPLLSNDDWRESLSRSIDSAAQEESMHVVAFVFMPEHVQLLVDPQKPKPDIGRFLARLKQPFSSKIKKRLIENKSSLLQKLTVRERPGKFCFRYWQEGPGYDRNFNQPKSILSAIDYIHENPVRRNMCRRAIDWKWSSAVWYQGEPSQQQVPELPLIHGLRPGTLDG